MKRSEQIVLILSGAVASALVGCSDSDDLKLSTATTYTNNHYVPGVGYYHAPFYGWFPHPYNTYDPARGYYYGGHWNAYPALPAVAASQPTASAVRQATAGHQTHTAATRRGGFGSSSRSGVT